LGELLFDLHRTWVVLIKPVFEQEENYKMWQLRCIPTWGCPTSRRGKYRV